MENSKRMKKALGGGLLALALAFSVALPGAAFAIGGGAGWQLDEGGDANVTNDKTTKAAAASWIVPTTPMTNVIYKDASGNVVDASASGAKAYKVLSTWAMAWSTSGPDFLGISNSSFYGNGGNGNANVTSATVGAQQTLLGIWASEANESPNAYNWNSFYNLYASAETSAEATDWACPDGNSPQWDKSGVWSPFKYRPEVIWLCNDLNATQTNEYVGYIKAGRYYAGDESLELVRESITPEAYAKLDEDKKSGYEADDASNPTEYYIVITPEAYEKLKDTEKELYKPDNESSATKYYKYKKVPATTSTDTKETYYVAGDETYNPYIIQPLASNGYTFVESTYDLADIADKVVSNTATNTDLASDSDLNWKTVGALPRSNRYSESPQQCALYIEQLARGSAYYTLEKIADGTVAKKKVAFVAATTGSDDITQAATTSVGVGVFDYLEGMSDRAGLHGRVDWAALVVDQLGQDGSLQVIEGKDHVLEGQSNAADADNPDYMGVTRASCTSSYYTATADDLLSCDVIYAARSAYTVDQWRDFLSRNASAANKAKAQTIEIIAGTPFVCNGSNYTMDKMIYGAFAIDCIYPELWGNMELSTFWYKNIYHIKSAALNSAMTWAFGVATLPSTQSLLDASAAAAYDPATTIKKFDEGLAYYNAYKDTDPTMVRIAANKALDGSTTAKNGTANLYANFAPSSVWQGEQTAGGFKYVSTFSGTIDIKTPTNDDKPTNNTPTNTTPAQKSAQTITVAKASYTKIFGNAAFNLGAKTNGDGKLTYASSNTKVATVSAAGKVTIKGVGKATITVKCGEGSKYAAAANKTVSITVNKAAQPMTVKAKTKTLAAKAKGKTTIKVSKSLVVSKKQGALTYAKSGKWNSKISINKKTGAITVKKGLKKNKTYSVKVKVTAAGSANYKAGSKTVTLKIKVK